MSPSPPNVFAAVHKGLRQALFGLCTFLGRADDAQWREAQRRARDVVRFIDHHTQAEDTLLLPMLALRAPVYFDRMLKAHNSLEAAREQLLEAIGADGRALYHAACTFTAAHLEHMTDEEVVHLPVIHIHLSTDELLKFERQAAELPPVEDREVLLGYMLEAMGERELETFVARARQSAPAEALVAFNRVVAAARQRR